MNSSTRNKIIHLLYSDNVHYSSLEKLIDPIRLETYHSDDPLKKYRTSNVLPIEEYAHNYSEDVTDPISYEPIPDELISTLEK